MLDKCLLVGHESKKCDRATLDLLKIDTALLECKLCWQSKTLMTLHTKTVAMFHRLDRTESLWKCSYQIKLPQDSCMQHPCVLRSS